MMKTEKRHAKVGERILITKANLSEGHYKNGDILEVGQLYYERGVKTTVDGMVHIRHDEYEVIVADKPKKSERITALETQVAVQREELDALQAKVEALESAGTSKFFDTTNVEYPLTARFECESAEVDAIMADIKRKAKPPNEQRADVIKRAKSFVSEWTKRAGSIVKKSDNSDLMNRGSLNTEFIVNAEKRTVVCISKSCTYGCIRSKGIAKCDPDDVFNADIGKAIALARALGVEVPENFLKAVQPTEVVVGQIVGSINRGKSFAFSDFKVKKVSEVFGKVRVYDDIDAFATIDYVVMLDDTDAVYE